ncbi:MAG: formylglycine-generating enzyme family protein [Pseudohongiellaceae bacterium]
MLAIILFVSYWMARASMQQADTTQQTAAQQTATQQAEAVSTSSANTSTSFSPATWMLPADPLLGFVLIPAGEFIMGSNPAVDRMAYANERWSAESQQGQIALPLYYIGRFEVTNAQFHAYQQATGAASAVNLADEPADFPATGITLPEALAYTRWLEKQLRNSSDIPEELQTFLAAGAQLSLPSEAEWEKAARGTGGQIFPWGSQPRNDFANFLSSRGSDAPNAVGSLACPACAFGLSDMSGNVWELTRSPMQDYPFDSQDDAEVLGADALWVMRGGSYADTIGNVRAAVRGGVDPGVRNATIGFRLVLGM